MDEINPKYTKAAQAGAARPAAATAHAAQRMQEVKRKVKLASFLQQHTQADKAASNARIAKLTGLRKEMAAIDREAQELKQVCVLFIAQAGVCIVYCSSRCVYC